MVEQLEKEIPAVVKYSGPEDIYHELVDNPGNSWIFGLLAFAVIEEQKIEWIRHHREYNGTDPSLEQINDWYLQQPPGVILRAKGTAENALQVYSSEVLEEVDDEIREKIQESVIIGEIKDLKRFWPQFGVNLAGGFLSSVLFALLLVALAVIILNDTSPVNLSEKIKTQLEVTDNGEK